MHLNKQLMFAIGFARFCARHRVDPHDLAAMCKYADMSKSAYERNDTAKENAYAEVVENICRKYKLGCEWNGLYPTIVTEEFGSEFLP